MNFLYRTDSEEAQVCLKHYLCVCVCVCVLCIYDRDRQTDRDKPWLTPAVRGDRVFPVPLSKWHLSAPQTLVHIKICRDHGALCVNSLCVCVCAHVGETLKNPGRNWGGSHVATSPAVAELDSSQTIRQKRNDRNAFAHTWTILSAPVLFPLWASKWVCACVCVWMCLCLQVEVDWLCLLTRWAALRRRHQRLRSQGRVVTA